MMMTMIQQVSLVETHSLSLFVETCSCLLMGVCVCACVLSKGFRLKKKTIIRN